MRVCLLRMLHDRLSILKTTSADRTCCFLLTADILDCLIHCNASQTHHDLIAQPIRFSSGSCLHASEDGRLACTPLQGGRTKHKTLAEILNKAMSWHIMYTCACSSTLISWHTFGPALAAENKHQTHLLHELVSSCLKLFCLLLQRRGVVNAAFQLMQLRNRHSAQSVPACVPSQHPHADQAGCTYVCMHRYSTCVHLCALHVPSCALLW